jgi:hypothetical protein
MCKLPNIVQTSMQNKCPSERTEYISNLIRIQTEYLKSFTIICGQIQIIRKITHFQFPYISDQKKCSTVMLVSESHRANDIIFMALPDGGQVSWY